MAAAPAPALQIGPIAIADPVALAPMSGVTDQPFRRIVRRFFTGGLIVTEMIASREAIRAAEADPRLAFDPAEEGPLSVQLAGWDPPVMAEAARLVERLGATIIDINMGCPARKVTARAAGAALMRDLGQARAVLEAVVAAVSVPVTLKMRLGYTEAQPNALALSRIAAAVGVQLVTLHGRYASQMYRGRADWAAIAAVARAIDLPVIGNGDIDGPATACQRMAAAGVAGVMVGRAAYGRPWLPAQIAAGLAGRPIPQDPSPVARGRVLADHYRLMCECFGVWSAVRRMRKHLAWYASGLRDATHFRTRTAALEDPDQVLAAIDQFFASAEPDPGAHPGAGADLADAA